MKRFKVTLLSNRIIRYIRQIRLFTLVFFLLLILLDYFVALVILSFIVYKLSLMLQHFCFV